MSIFHSNLEAAVRANDNYRQVIYTDPNIQIVLYSLRPGEYIPTEKHKGTQFLRISAGSGKITINGEKFRVGAGFAIAVPPGVKHKIANTSKKRLFQFYSIYSPPAHKPGEVNKRFHKKK